MISLVPRLLLLSALLIPSAPPQRPVCPTYNGLYEVALERPEIVAPGLGRVMVRPSTYVEMAVAQVVGRDGALYGDPVVALEISANTREEVFFAVPPEPLTPRYDVVPGVLVRTWRPGDAINEYVCRQAILLPGARQYVPLVTKP